MLAKLPHDANTGFRHEQQALRQVDAKGPDIQAPEHCFSVLTLFDQIWLRHHRLSAKAQSGQGFSPFDTPILRCKLWS